MTVRAGIDTWKPCWRVDPDSELHRALEALALIPTARGGLLPEPVLGHRVVWYRGVGLLAAQGHPGGDGVLAPPSSLAGALAALQAALSEAVGVALPGPMRFEHSSHGFAGVGRLDSTVDFGFDRGAIGMALLAGIAAARPPGRLQSHAIREPGGRAIETVTWAAKRILARAYDKSVESNLGARGTIVRLEQQQDWPSGHRRDVAELTGEYVCDSFRRRFVPLWRANRGVTVVAMTDLAERLAQLVRDEQITPQEAKRVYAHLGFEAAGVSVGSRNTRWRDRMLAERVGLVVADGVLESCEIDLAETIALAFDPATWDANDLGVSLQALTGDEHEQRDRPAGGRRMRAAARAAAGA